MKLSGNIITISPEKFKINISSEVHAYMVNVINTQIDYRVTFFGASVTDINFLTGAWRDHWIFYVECIPTSALQLHTSLHVVSSL